LQVLDTQCSQKSTPAFREGTFGDAVIISQLEDTIAE